VRRVNVLLSISLDGVIQAPGRPEEDTRGGFTYGGWAVPYNDEVMGRKMAEEMAEPSDMLFGRRTYENFAGFWPHQTDANPFTAYLNSVTKYVVSNTLTESLPWQNSILVPGDPVEGVARLKATDGPNLSITGSGQLVRTLLAAGLVDELFLLVHPLVLGSGQRLFTEAGGYAELDLVESTTTTKGVVMSRYRPRTS
jgi:dihydrofolate reductase